MKNFVLGVLLTCVASSGFAFEGPIKSDSPREYIVTRGDTLWDISNRFLKSPWLWPEIWHANAQIHNPHLIFPGDVISLVYIEGRPRLTIVRRGESGRTIKLSPKVRTLPAESAIPAIPLQAIDSFLNSSRIFTNMQEMEAASLCICSQTTADYRRYRRSDLCQRSGESPVWKNPWCLPLWSGYFRSGQW